MSFPLRESSRANKARITAIRAARRKQVLRTFTERLEDRRLLSYSFSYTPTDGAAQVVVNESGGHDSFIVRNNGSNLLEYSTDGGNNYSAQWGGPSNLLSADFTSSLTINLGADNSAIVVGTPGSFASSASALKVNFQVNCARGQHHRHVDRRRQRQPRERRQLCLRQ